MSLAEVANIAKVSNSTVSRVINGRNNVSPSTVLAVKKAIKVLGYVPPEPGSRRGPSTNAYPGVKTHNVAIVWFDAISELLATHFIQAVTSISEALVEYGLNPVLCITNTSKKLPHVISKGDIDGYMIIGGEPKGPLVSKFENIPTVWMTSRHTPSGDYVIEGNEMVGRIAGKYLINRGHKEIAFFNAFPNQPGIVARGTGLSFMAYQAGIQVKNYISNRLNPVDTYPQTLKELETEIAVALNEMLQQRPLPTGLFIPEDLITAVVYRLLQKNGIRPGIDIDIISADNELPYLAGLNPRPATIDIGYRVNGRHAVEQLMWRLRNPDEQRSVQVVIEPVLIEGDDEYVRQPI